MYFFEKIKAALVSMVKTYFRNPFSYLTNQFFFCISNIILTVHIIDPFNNLS